jgi:hypothetical protein
MSRTAPILDHKDHGSPSVFVAENLLREARRQRSIAPGSVPPLCILDPDGDLARYLLSRGQAGQHPPWACYHTALYRFERDTLEFGILPYAVGSSFAVLVAEEFFASGCRL